MIDEHNDGGKAPPESETDPSFNPTKVQDLVKADRDDVNPRDGEE